jgi:hypothetical protein
MASGDAGGRAGAWRGRVASRGRARATRFRAKPGARRPIRPFPGQFAVAGYGRREREGREMVSGSFVIRPKFKISSVNSSFLPLLCLK